MAAIELFHNGVSAENVSITAPAVNAFDITPSDTAEITYITRGLFCGTSGTVKVQMSGGGVVTFQGVAAGTTLPVRVKMVYATGTTASGIIGLI